MVSILAFLFLFLKIGAGQNSLENKHLDVIVSHLPSLITVTKDASGNFTFGGRGVTELDYIARKLKFSYSLRPSPGNIAGVIVNGTYNGVIGELMRHKADLALYAFAASIERYQVIDFAGTMEGDFSAMLIKYPEAGFSSWTVYKPYKITIWMAWAASFVAVSLASWIFYEMRTKYIDRANTQLRTVNDMIMYFLGTFTSQGGYYRSGHKSLGLLAATWCAAAFVFVYSYSSVLVSFLSIQYKTPEVNTIDDLAARSDVQVSAMKGTIYEIELLSAPSGDFKTLGDRLLKCPSCRTATLEEVGVKVLQGNHVGVMSRSVVSGLINQNYVNTHQCGLTRAFQQYGWKAMYWGVPKHSPYIEDINRETLWFVDLGFHHMAKRVEEAHPECVLKFNYKGVATQTIKSQRLTLKQFYGAFLILPVGYLLAFVVFIYEIIRKKFIN